MQNAAAAVLPAATADAVSPQCNVPPARYRCGGDYVFLQIRLITTACPNTKTLTHATVAAPIAAAAAAVWGDLESAPTLRLCLEN